MAVTTVFSAPPKCTGGVTTMATDTGNLWLNVIDPVPTVTMTKCYPSQFIASALATTTLPPFSKIVCPNQWESYNVNSTYVICCPNGFTLYAPHYTDTARPGRNAICSSVIWPSVLMDITSYDASSLVTVLPETAGVNGSIVYATAFDGNIVIPVNPVSSSSQSVVSSKSSTILSSSPASTTTSAKTTTTTSTVSSQPPSTLSIATKTSSFVTTTWTTKTTSTSKTSTTSSAILPAISSLPSCGQTCMNNMLGQYAVLGCSSADPAPNTNFSEN